MGLDIRGGQIHQLGLAAEHEDPVQAVEHAGFHVGVQPVAHHGGVAGLSAQDVQGVVDDLLVRFAHDLVGHTAGGRLDIGVQRTDVRHEARLGGAVVVGMGADVGQAVPDEVAEFAQLGIVERGIEGGDDHVGMVLLQLDASLLKLVQQYLIAEQVYLFAGEMLLEIGHRGVA